MGQDAVGAPAVGDHANALVGDMLGQERTVPCEAVPCSGPVRAGNEDNGQDSAIAGSDCPHE